MRVTYQIVIPEPLSKIQSIRMIRVLSGLGLKEAKDLVDSGYVVLTGRMETDQSLAVFAVAVAKAVDGMRAAGCRFYFRIQVEAEDCLEEGMRTEKPYPAH
jgi:hypothetical protein